MHMFSNPLVPLPPVPITSSMNVDCPVAVSGTSAGYMAVWQDNEENIQSSFSSDRGASWSDPVQVGSNSSYVAWVAGNDSGFVVVWVNTDVGISNGSLYASFSEDDGLSWSMPTRVSPTYDTPGGTVNVFSGVSATEEGFLATWMSDDGYPSWNVWSGFSSNGTDWNASVQATSYMVSGITVVSNGLINAGTGSKFVAAFEDESSNGYVIFSDNSGSSWGAPIMIATSLNGFAPTVGASSTGFMAVWSTTSNIAYSSFSIDGTSWGSPMPIASNVSDDFVLVSGAPGGFIASWQDLSSDAEASFSSDGGTTWSLPVLFASDMSLSGGLNSFVGVSATTAGCMFTWWDNDSNGISSFAPFSGGIRSGNGFFRQIVPTHPGGSLFH